MFPDALFRPFLMRPLTLKQTRTLAVLPPAVFLLYCFALGLALPLAAWSVVYRDLEHILALVMTAWFYLTPVFYRAEAVPEPLRSFLQLNPLSYVVEDFRRVLIWSQLPDWSAWCVAMVIGSAILVLGYAWFMITKTGFPDVL